MKTTNDIPDRNQPEAVGTANRDAARRRRLERLAAQLGTFEKVMTPEELLRLRVAD